MSSNSYYFSPNLLLKHGHALITLTIVGILVGVLASMMESTTHFLSDLRLGYCTWNYFAPEYVCCKEVAVLTAAATPLHSQQPKSIFFSSDLGTPSPSSNSKKNRNNGNDNDDDTNVLFSATTCSSFVRWSAPKPFDEEAASEGSDGDYVEGGTRTVRGFVFYVGFSVIFAGLAAMICSLHHPQSVAGSGIPQVKSILSGGRVLHHFLSFPVILAKSCALVLGVGSGLFIGKEGPLVHLGVAIGTTVRRTLRRCLNNSHIHHHHHDQIILEFENTSQDEQHQNNNSNTSTSSRNSPTTASSSSPSSLHLAWGDNKPDDIDLDPPDVSSAESNELLCAAAAAGVATGFAAPLGGLLYVVEELSFRFPRRTMIRSFLCAITATLTLKIIDATYTGRPLQFSVDAASASWRWGELIVLFPILGVCCGLVGGFTVSMIQKAIHFKKVVMEKIINKLFLKNILSHGQVRILEVCLIALVSAVINYTIVPQYLDRGSFEVLHDLFVPFNNKQQRKDGASSFSSIFSEVFALFVAGFIRIFMFALAFNIQVPAGSLVPSLFLGACFGRAFGLIMEHIASSYATINGGTSSGNNNFILNEFFSCAPSSFSSTSTTSSSSNSHNNFDPDTASFLQNLFASSSNGLSSFYSPTVVDDQFLDDLSSASSKSSSEMMKNLNSASAAGGGNSNNNCNSQIAPGMYAALGAAATLTGVTRMTMCLVMIVVEMTGAPSYVLPCTVVSLCAKRAVEWLDFPCIFDINTCSSSNNTNRNNKHDNDEDQDSDENTSFFPHPPASLSVTTVNKHNRNRNEVELDEGEVELNSYHYSRKKQNALNSDDGNKHSPIVKTVETLQELIQFTASSSSSATTRNKNNNHNTIDLSSGMTIEQVRKRLFLFDDDEETCEDEQQQHQEETVSRLQPILIVTRNERVDKLPILLGIIKAGKIIDELDRHCLAAESSEENDIVVFSAATSTSSSSHQQQQYHLVNLMHLFETSFLTVSTTMEFSVLFERLQHDSDTTCVVVVDQLGAVGGIPVAAFSRQFLMEHQHLLPKNSSSSNGGH